MTVTTYQPTIRIPNLPSGPIVDANGYPTMEEQTFRQALLTLLQNLFGDAGMVMPSQTTANMTTIQNNQQETPGTTTGFVYTCAPGTFLYNSDTNEIMVTVIEAGVPVFKTVTIS